jgi:hypothetical protein
MGHFRPTLPVVPAGRCLFRVSLPQFKNICALRTLGANQANQGSVLQLPRRESNKERQMILCFIKGMARAHGMS